VETAVVMISVQAAGLPVTVECFGQILMIMMKHANADWEDFRAIVIS